MLGTMLPGVERVGHRGQNSPAGKLTAIPLEIIAIGLCLRSSGRQCLISIPVTPINALQTVDAQCQEYRSRSVL